MSLHQYFNSYVGNPTINTFFKFITYLGDGNFSLLIVIILLFFSVKRSLLLLLAYALSGAITQILKFGFFNDVNRPFHFASYKGLKIKIVEGVDMHIHNSFPSGHATAAFSLFICICFLTKNKLLKFSCLVMAVITAFSRVYLSQHFFEDIYVGSMIGVVFAGLCYYFLYYSNTSFKFEKINKPIQHLFSKKNA